MPQPDRNPLIEPDPAPRLGPAAAGRCRRRIHLDHDPDADRTRRRPPEPGVQLRLDTLAAHRRSVHDALSAGMTLSEDWAPRDGDRPALAWAPRLDSETRFATPDLLIRMPDGGYVPILVRGHRTTDPGSGAYLADLRPALSVSPAAMLAAAQSHAASPADLARSLATARRSTTRKMRSHHRDSLALAHAYRLLQDFGIASTQMRGGIIGFGSPADDPGWDDGAVIVWHLLAEPGGADSGGGEPTVLEEYDARFADRLRVARAAAGRLPALARPSKISECRTCPWWPVCGPELAAAHDVSLLAAGNDVDILRAAGASTYDDVAAMPPATVAALPLTGIPPREARLRARALVAGIPLVRRREALDPVRADVEMDVDMESYGDEGAYLWGTLLSGAPIAGHPPGYRPFVTWQGLDSDAAATNFVAFWAYLNSVRTACARAGLSFAAYCYSHQAEERWLLGTPARFPGRPGMPTREEVVRFCRSDEWIDLLQEVKRLFVRPGSLRLKSIAPLAGFAWRDAEPGGENSMAWYRIAAGRDSAPADDVAAYRTRVLRYNEDDVRATLRLRQWISDSGHTVPTIADVNARFDADTGVV